MRRKSILLLFTCIFAVLFAVSCASDSVTEAERPSDDGKEITAYLLKIDGKQECYLATAEEVKRFEALLIEYAPTVPPDTEIVRVSVNSSIEGEVKMCDADEIVSADDAARRFYENGGKLSLSVTVNERERKYISFETVYSDSASYYEGTKVVKRKGENGERELVYEVTYTDGVQSARELVSDQVVKEAVDEQVLVGTKKSTASTGKYAWPLSSVYITSSYGGRYLSGKYDYHLGVDLRASTGTSVYAADGGEVVYAGWLSSYGYLVRIKHDNGDQTYYAHLSRINVSVGSRVYKGQLIAKSGATGNVTGAHLHFEIRKNGSTVNPVSYLPSLKSAVILKSVSPDSCCVQREAYLSRSEPRAFLSSTREREEYLLLRHPSHAQ